MLRQVWRSVGAQLMERLLQMRRVLCALGHGGPEPSGVNAVTAGLRPGVSRRKRRGACGHATGTARASWAHAPCNASQRVESDRDGLHTAKQLHSRRSIGVAMIDGLADRQQK
jgi:hypothetical protein